MSEHVAQEVKYFKGAQYFFPFEDFLIHKLFFAFVFNCLFLHMAKKQCVWPDLLFVTLQ